MTDIQAFKAAVVVGARCVFQAQWCPKPTIRTVTIAQSNKAAFTHPTRVGDSWLDFPKASEITQPKPGLFIIEPSDGPKIGLAYDFRPESIATVDAHNAVNQG